MSLHEIDDLLKASIELVRSAEESLERQRQVIWNLEQLPERYEFDAGGFAKSEQDPDFEYREMDAFELSLFVVRLAGQKKNPALVYDWSAFMLNWGPGYFDGFENVELLKRGELAEMKEIFTSFDHAVDEERYPSLTLDVARFGKGDAAGELMRWFLQ